MGYLPVHVNQKTSLKKECVNGDCLSSEFDNIFYNTKIKKLNSGILHFYKNFNTFKEARMISDHIPIWFEFSIN
jgi:hypothetical protein